MKLFHYTAKPFEFDCAKEYVQGRHWKPSGLWVSVDGEDDWPTWCRGEEWGLEALEHRAEVVIRKDANLLIINSLGKLDAFNKNFGSGNNNDSGNIDWDRVKLHIDGLIIAPYQWERRHEYMWYYGWDCASGCIWNLSVIESIRQEIFA